MPIVFADDKHQMQFFNCNNPKFRDALIFTGKLIQIARIVVPVLIVVVAFYAFSKAVLSQDDKAIHSALIATIRKIAIAVAIFFIPFLLIKIVEFTLDKFNSEGTYDCINLLDDPGKANIGDDYECDSGWLGNIGDGPKLNPGKDDKRYGSPAFYLNQALNLMKYLGIILCIVLSVYDFMKVITNPDKDAYTKAISGTIKRLAYAITIFVLPILVIEILKLLNIVSICSDIGGKIGG